MALRRSATVALALLVLAPTAMALSLPVGESTFLVGYEPGKRGEVLAAIPTIGGRADLLMDALRVARVKVPSTVSLDVLASIPGVSFAEREGRTTLAGAQWNGAQWDGAQWDGAQWNGQTFQNGTEWGHAVVRTADAWTVQPGNGAAKLCVADTGIDERHPDLSGNVDVTGYNAITRLLVNASDDAGHGTHVAGIAAAVRGNGIGVSGVTQSRLLSVKVLDSTGQGTTTALALGLQWCADAGADVVLLALSVDGTSSTVRRALDLLEARGVVVVASAGNKACASCVSFPANQTSVLAVTALASNGAIAPFSSTGPEADLAAPGVGIISTYDEGTYAAGSGTSQAAAWVAGAATLLREHRPGLPPAQVRDALRQGAHDAGPAGPDAQYGAGVLDVAGALSALGG